MVVVKSIPDLRLSIDNDAADEEADIVLLVCSRANSNFRIDRASAGSLVVFFGSRGVFVFFVNSVAKCLSKRSSRVCPPIVHGLLAKVRVKPSLRATSVNVVDECPTSIRS